MQKNADSQHNEKGAKTYIIKAVGNGDILHHVGGMQDVAACGRDLDVDRLSIA